MVLNVPLKTAIIASGKTQRQIARSARLPETRLSHIVRGYGPEASKTEKATLARVLGTTVDALFPQSEAVA